MNSPLDFIACGHRVNSVFLFPSHCILLCPLVNMFVISGIFMHFSRSVLSFIQRYTFLILSVDLLAFFCQYFWSFSFANVFFFFLTHTDCP